MNDVDPELAELIRGALPPVDQPPDPGDLWPRVEQRLRGARSRGTGWDWLLAALAAGLVAVFPEALLLVLYHL